MGDIISFNQPCVCRINRLLPIWRENTETSGHMVLDVLVCAQGLARFMDLPRHQTQTSRHSILKYMHACFSYSLNQIQIICRTNAYITLPYLKVQFGFKEKTIPLCFIATKYLYKYALVEYIDK